MMTATLHPKGPLRVEIGSSGSATWASIYDGSTAVMAPINIMLHSPAEIAAFRALSEALAKQDVVEGVEV